LRIAPVNNKGDDDISAIVFTVGDNYTTEKNTKDYQGTLDIWSAVMRGGKRKKALYTKNYRFIVPYVVV
jgi:hypothetical protein